jgi:GT2 family glycosyltransferase
VNRYDPARPLGIVIVTYNSAATLDLSLSSVEGYDVVVVDNASSDGSVELARGREGVVSISLPSNLGLAAASNIGIDHIPGRDVFLMNPDLIVPPGALDQLHDLARRSDAGILLPRLVFPDGTAQLSTRPLPSVIEIFGRLLARRPAHASEEPAAAGLVPVDWGLGAAMLVRREVLDDIGPLDDGYVLYFEDVDLCLRTWRSGHTVVMATEVAMGHHYQRASNAKWAMWRRPVRLHWRSFARYLRRHPREALRLNSRPVFATR